MGGGVNLKTVASISSREWLWSKDLREAERQPRRGLEGEHSKQHEQQVRDTGRVEVGMCLADLNNGKRPGWLRESEHVRVIGGDVRASGWEVQLWRVVEAIVRTSPSTSLPPAFGFLLSSHASVISKIQIPCPN